MLYAPAQKPLKKITATMKTMPAMMPTHAATWVSRVGRSDIVVTAVVSVDDSDASVIAVPFLVCVVHAVSERSVCRP
ncbi:hypothetical protein BAB77_05755 [Mycobacteroides abscessus]|nr:hypothetical protein BAB77_05755 [Mycobacteroides abscessus]